MIPHVLADALATLLATHERHIVLTTGGDPDADLNSLQEAHPRRVIHCGGAEQAAVLAAAGLAAESWRPVLVLHAPRLTGRATALFEMLAAQEAPDALLLLTGALPPGVARPLGTAATVLTDRTALSAALGRIAAATGPRVLHLEGATARG